MLVKGVNRSDLDIVFIGGTAALLRIAERDEGDIRPKGIDAEVRDGFWLILSTTLGAVTLTFAAGCQRDEGGAQDCNHIFRTVHLASISLRQVCVFTCLYNLASPM